MKLVFYLLISLIVLDIVGTSANVVRRYQPTKRNRTYSHRALIDGDIDPLIAALIVESMHHSSNNVNRRQNTLTPISGFRKKILTVNKINRNFLPLKK